MDLSGKLALVTGAGSGMGRAIVHALAREGCQVIGIGRTDTKLEETIARFEGKGSISAKVVDVGSREQVEEFVTAMIEKFRTPDILVNNAGVNIKDRELKSLSPDDWEHVIGVNLNGVFYLTHAILPAMSERRSGLIINISSLAGVRASVLGGAAYSASKFGLNALSGVISQEYASKGIRSTVICPGEVNTPILDNRPEPVSDEHREAILQSEDIASAVLFIAKLPDRAHVPELIIKPVMQDFA